MLLSMNNTIVILILLFNIDRISSRPKNVERGLEREKNKLEQATRQLQSERKNFEIELKYVQNLISPNDLIRINVGGQIIVTRRDTLTKVPNSKLAKWFDRSNQVVMPRDYEGNYFLDYNPVLFSYLLDQLRTLKNNKTIVFRPPLSSPSAPFNQMLQDLDLPLPPISENDVIALNVGGEKIVTLRKTLAAASDPNIALLISNSTKVIRDRIGRPFLDYDPILFRCLLEKLREGEQANLNANNCISTKTVIVSPRTTLPRSTIKPTTRSVSPRPPSKSLHVSTTKQLIAQTVNQKTTIETSTSAPVDTHQSMFDYSEELNDSDIPLREDSTITIPETTTRRLTPQNIVGDNSETGYISKQPVQSTTEKINTTTTQPETSTMPSTSETITKDNYFEETSTESQLSAKVTEMIIIPSVSLLADANPIGKDNSDNTETQSDEDETSIQADAMPNVNTAEVEYQDEDLNTTTESPEDDFPQEVSNEPDVSTKTIETIIDPVTPSTNDIHDDNPGFGNGEEDDND